MKKLAILLLFILAETICLNGSCQLLPSFSLKPIGAQRIPVAINKMVNLVFPGTIRAGIKVSKDVTVQKVKGVENVIEVKATRRNFTPTNLSIFCLDGRLYSFELYYSEDPDTLNYEVSAVKPIDSSLSDTNIQLAGLPVPLTQLEADAGMLETHGFMHSSVTNQRMRMTLRGIYLKDSLLWLVCRLSNSSMVPYRPAYVRLYVADKKSAKRTATQEVAVTPVYTPFPPTVHGNSRETLALAYPVFTISKQKRLLLQVAEENGGRLLTIIIPHQRLLRARKAEFRDNTAK